MSPQDEWICELPNNNGSGICLRGSTKDNKRSANTTQPPPLQFTRHFKSEADTNYLSQPQTGLFLTQDKIPDSKNPLLSQGKLPGGRRGGLNIHCLMTSGPILQTFLSQFSPSPTKCELSQPFQTGFQEAISTPSAPLENKFISPILGTLLSSITSLENHGFKGKQL